MGVGFCALGFRALISARSPVGCNICIFVFGIGHIRDFCGGFYALGFRTFLSARRARIERIGKISPHGVATPIGTPAVTSLTPFFGCICLHLEKVERSWYRCDVGISKSKRRITALGNYTQKKARLNLRTQYQQCIPNTRRTPTYSQRPQDNPPPIRSSNLCASLGPPLTNLKPPNAKDSRSSFFVSSRLHVFSNDTHPHDEKTAIPEHTGSLAMLSCRAEDPPRGYFYPANQRW